MATWRWDTHVYTDTLSHAGVGPAVNDRRDYIVEFCIFTILLEDQSLLWLGQVAISSFRRRTIGCTTWWSRLIINESIHVDYVSC